MKAMKIIGIVLAAVVLISAAGILYLKDLTDKKAQSLVFEKVDMKAVADGTYTGVADAGIVYVRLGVTVKNHAITDIDIIEHRNGKGKNAESMTASMVAKNTCDVDTVSGATLSSNAIKSAASVALHQGVK